MKKILVLCLFATFCLSLGAQKVAVDTTKGVVEEVVVSNELTYVKLKANDKVFIVWEKSLEILKDEKNILYKDIKYKKNERVVLIYNRKNEVISIMEDKHIGIDPMFL